VILFVAAATANPIHEVEVAEDVIASNSEDWQLVPDTNGHLHLVDINALDTDMEPQFNARNDMTFRLFTRLNPTISRTVRIANNGDLSGSNFNGANPSRYHIHGWQGGGTFTGSGIRRAWLDRISCNVFTVDWGAGASTINYVTARNRVPAVAAVVAEFIDWVHAQTNTPFSAVSVIGHSLGGHIAGLTGKNVRRGRLQSVVAMDPAGPLFSIRNPTERVHHTDANYVEVIYTDQGNLGFDEPLGHANFYPNWGSRQPGCGLDIGGLCSHNIVEDFFEASINPANIFGARQCRGFSGIRLRTCITSGPSRRMGGEPVMDGVSAPETVFFLETNSRSPFAQGPI
jgi:pimeloyl-ACP methyl ester carboxylesterase